MFLNQGWIFDKPGIDKYVAQVGSLSEYGLYSTEQKDISLWLPLMSVKPNWVRGSQGIGDCLMGNTKILMADGSEKNIEDISVGEYVITSTGNRRRVIDTIKKEYSGDIYHITIKGENRIISVTPDHNLLGFPGIGLGRQSVGRYNENKQEQYIPANQLKIGSRLHYSWCNGPESKEDLEILNVIDILKDQFVENKINKKFEVDEDFAWMIGLYLGDGGVSGNKSSPNSKTYFCLSEAKKDAGTITKLCSILTKYNLKYTISIPKNNPKLRQINIYNSVFSRFIKKIIPGNTYTKVVPTFIFRSPKEIRLSCLRGWMEADGHFSIKENGNGVCSKLVGVSVCEQLVNDFHRLAKTLKIRGSQTIHPKYKQSKQSYNLSFYGENSLKIYPEKQKEVLQKVVKRGLLTKKRDVVKNGLAKPITNISIEKVEKIQVYCLNVEQEHQFIANGVTSKNCVSWGVELPCTVLLAIQDQLGVSEWIEEAATESIYGLSRVEVYGKKSGGYSDGATGYGGAMAVHKFGVLLRQDYSSITNNAEHDLTKYDAKKAKAWGNFGCGGQNDKNLLDEVAKKHPVQAVTSIQTIEEALSALTNGYPISCASMAGFGNMTRNKDGIVRMSGQWAHQMCVLGTRWVSGKPLFRLFQSWGNSCGTENDPGIQFPNISKCSWWITESDLNWIIKNGEVYSYSDVQGFPARKLKFKEATDQWG